MRIDSEQADDPLDEHIGELGLDVRTVNALEKAAVFTLADLLNCTSSRLLEIPNFGHKTLETIYRKLEAKGFYRKSSQINERG